MHKIFMFLAVALFATAAKAEPPMGDDGLYKPFWLEETFYDLREDLEEANAQGKRLMVMIEQRGCAYCKKMHEDVFTQPEIEFLLDEEFFVLQINMFGDLDVTDFDGEVLSEKDMVMKWRSMFTPTIFFFREEMAEDASAGTDWVALIPGAFSAGMTKAMLEWVLDHGYDSGVNFQKHYAQLLAQGN